MISHLLLAISTFVITNLDDLLILSFYFANPKYRIPQVVIGQFLGITCLILVSLIGLVFGNFVEAHWISLLGLFPIFIGIRDLVSNSEAGEEENPNAVSQKSTVQFISVALVTIANGGDNIGVYVPLFASTSVSAIYLYIITFLVMTAMWCAVAFYFVSHPVVRGFFISVGKRLMPYFLILLGLIIMKDFFLWLLQ